MAPRRKILLLIYALVLPYIGLVVYFAFANSARSEQAFPSWFPYFGLSYILFTVVLVMIVSRRVFRNTPQEVPQKARWTQWWARGWAIYLVVIWSGLLIYGGYETVKGDIPIRRAIPAGGFLLAFIGLFSWSLYRDFQIGKQGTNKK